MTNHQAFEKVIRDISERLGSEADDEGKALAREIFDAGYAHAIKTERMAMNDSEIKVLVDKFLAWPLPESVCSDACVTDREYQFSRSGTNLLTATETEELFRYLFAEAK